MLEKVMQNGCKIIKNDAKMTQKWIQQINPNIYAKIDPNIYAKIGAKFVIQKSIKNQALGRQGPPCPPAGASKVVALGVEGLGRLARGTIKQ